MSFRLAKDKIDRVHTSQKLVTNVLCPETYKNLPLMGGALYVYRPGYTGPEIKGIYSTWSALYADLSSVASFKVIYFDDTDGSLIIPPSSTPYDMTDVEWRFLVCFPPTGVSTINVTIQDGCTFKNLCSISGLLNLDYQGTTQPCMVYDPLGVEPAVENTTTLSLFLTNGATISCSGTREFLRIVSANHITLMNIGSVIAANAYQPIFIAAGGAEQIIMLTAFTTINDDTLRGTGTVAILRGALNAQTGTTSASQPNFTGTFIFQDGTEASNIPYSNTSGDFASDPGNVKVALDRIANLLFLNFGAIPN